MKYTAYIKETSATNPVARLDFEPDGKWSAVWVWLPNTTGGWFKYKFDKEEVEIRLTPES